MPVYVYKNLATGETFEVEQRITESAWTAHPDTGEPVKRLVQPVGIAFKGSGFYVTDSRSGRGDGSARKGGSDGASANGGAGDGGSGASGESKKSENKGSDGKATSPAATQSSSASTGSSGGASD